MATPSGRPSRRAPPSASTSKVTESDAATAPTRPRSLEASPASTRVSGPTANCCPARETSPGRATTPRPTVSASDHKNFRFQCFGFGSFFFFLVTVEVFFVSRCSLSFKTLNWALLPFCWKFWWLGANKRFHRLTLLCLQSGSFESQATPQVGLSLI